MSVRQFPVPGASTGHGTALRGGVQAVIEPASKRDVVAIGHTDSVSENRDPLGRHEAQPPIQTDEFKKGPPSRPG